MVGLGTIGDHKSALKRIMKLLTIDDNKYKLFTRKCDTLVNKNDHWK